MSTMDGLFTIDTDTLNAGGFAPDVLNMALHWGILVPVEKCKHGNIDPHKAHRGELRDRPCDSDRCGSSIHWFTCEGAAWETTE